MIWQSSGKGCVAIDSVPWTCNVRSKNSTAQRTYEIGPFVEFQLFNPICWHTQIQPSPKRRLTLVLSRVDFKKRLVVLCLQRFRRHLEFVVSAAHWMERTPEPAESCPLPSRNLGVEGAGDPEHWPSRTIAKAGIKYAFRRKRLWTLQKNCHLHMWYVAAQYWWISRQVEQIQPHLYFNKWNSTHVTDDATWRDINSHKYTERSLQSMLHKSLS